MMPQVLLIHFLTAASTNRPALRSCASPSRGPISCRLVTATSAARNGIGSANAGLPAKFTATVFCRSSICASRRPIFEFDGIDGGGVCKVGRAMKSTFVKIS